MTASDRRLSSIVVRSGYLKDRLIDLYHIARCDGSPATASIARRAAAASQRHHKLASSWNTTRARLGLNG